MDLSFFRRAEHRFAGPAPACLDFGMLTAMLQAQQAGSAAAKAQALARPVRGSADPIVEILLGGADWRAAASALGGSFHPAFARQRAVN